jgi:drug/metabolite transporter (DMT)-like permease
MFGVLAVTRPGFGQFHPAVILAVLSTFCYAFYFLSTRVLSRTDSNATTLFYSNGVGAVLMLPVVPFFWAALTLGQLLLMMRRRAASFGPILIVARHAPPSLLVLHLHPTRLVVVLGYAVFGDVPDGWTLVGATIVIGSASIFSTASGSASEANVSAASADL